VPASTPAALIVPQRPESASYVPSAEVAFDDTPLDLLPRRACYVRARIAARGFFTATRYRWEIPVLVYTCGPDGVVFGGPSLLLLCAGL
jgi:hypothetical protein